LLGCLVTGETIRLGLDSGASPPIGWDFPVFIHPAWGVRDAERCLPGGDALGELLTLATSLGTVRRMGEEIGQHGLALGLAETRIFPEVVC
jgi:hypothetical protein